MARIIEHQIQFAEPVPVGSGEVSECEQRRRSGRDLFARVLDARADFSDLQHASGSGDVGDQLIRAIGRWGQEHQE